MPVTFPVDYTRVGDYARPLLSVYLTGPNGVPQPINGVVDSGADYTCLPYEMLRLLGFRGRRSLRERYINQVSGELQALQTTVPIRAYIKGLPKQPFELYPVFVRDAGSALWGRADFFRACRAVSFHEHEGKLGRVKIRFD